MSYNIIPVVKFFDQIQYHKVEAGGRADDLPLSGDNVGAAFQIHCLPDKKDQNLDQYARDWTISEVLKMLSGKSRLGDREVGWVGECPVWPGLLLVITNEMFFPPFRSGQLPSNSFFFPTMFSPSNSHFF